MVGFKLFLILKYCKFIIIGFSFNLGVMVILVKECFVVCEDFEFV